MQQGLEPELAVTIDVMYPMDKITRAASHSRQKYPHTSLRLYVEALGGVIEPLLDRRCTIGVIGSLPEVPGELHAEPLRDIPFVTVVSPAHPLASLRGTIPKAVLRKHVQLVLMDRTELTAGRDYAVVSPLTWRLGDLGAKLAFLRSGLGWGHMPLHMVREDIDAKTLARIRVEDVPGNASLPMKLAYRKDTPPGPAGRAFIAQLKS
jgi:DNA-binding transcriptional LysR family regulator